MNFLRRIYIYLPFAALFLLPVYSMAEEPSLQKPGIEEQETPGQGLAGFEAGNLSNFSFGVFGDATYTTESREKARNAFYIGELDLYSSASYGERLNFVTEVALETHDDETVVDLERLWVGYTFSDLLTVRAGRHHIPLGYWNRNYHHGRHLFVSVDRPFFLDFEHNDGVLPLHVVGVELEGRRRFGAGMFRYEFDIGNGPRIDKESRQLKSNASSDDNDSKQLVLRVSFSPAVLPDLGIGVSGTSFTVDTGSGQSIDEVIYGLDISYRYKGAGLLAEFFRFGNSQASGEAFYVQATYEATGYLTPYARFERLDVDSDDPYFTNLRGGIDREQFIAGLRCDIDPIASAIKAQYRYDDSKGGNDYSVFEIQWSFGF